MIESSKAVGLEPTETNDQVRYPRRSYVRSGHIVLEKKYTKTEILNKIAVNLVAKRAKQSK